MSKNIVKLKPVEAIGATEKEYEIEGSISSNSKAIYPEQLVPVPDEKYDADYEGFVLKQYKPNITDFSDAYDISKFKDHYTIDELKEKFGTICAGRNLCSGSFRNGNIKVKIKFGSEIDGRSNFIQIYYYPNYDESKLDEYGDYNGIYYLYYKYDGDEPPSDSWTKYDSSTGEEYDNVEAPELDPSTVEDWWSDDYEYTGDLFIDKSQFGLLLIDPDTNEDYEVMRASYTVAGWLPGTSN